MPEGRRKASWEHFWKLVQKLLRSTKSSNLGSLFEDFLTPWRYAESFMEFPDCKEWYLLRLLIPDLILGLILDLPKCAEQGSRCSLSLVFTCLACLKMTLKWTSKRSPLRLKISARLLLGPPRNDLGSVFCASELKLKHVSKMYRNEGRFSDLEAGHPTVKAPWSLWSPSNLHRISMESPWRKHRLRSDEDPYIYTRC